jgi:hypothetical protein
MPNAPTTCWLMVHIAHSEQRRLLIQATDSLVELLPSNAQILRMAVAGMFLPASYKMLLTMLMGRSTPER